MKLLSSIFSFNTLQPRIMQVVTQRAFIATLLVLVIIELALRVVIPSHHVPTGSWHNTELRDQAQQLAAMEAVDMFVTGSSIAAVNVVPTVLDATFLERNLAFNTFNGGIRGCNYSCINVGFHHMFLNQKKPSYVMLVVSPEDLNEANLGVVERSNEFIKTFNMENHVVLTVDTLSHIWLFGFRNEIREFLKSGKWIYEESMISRQGHIDMGDKKNSNVYRVKYDIQPDGPITKALFNLVESLTKKDIKIIILPGLMDSETRKLIDTKAMNNYFAILDTLGKQKSITLLDVDHLVPPDEHFIDPIHLNSKGSKNYTRNLSHYLINIGFPW